VAVWQDSSRKIQKLSIEAIEGWDFMKELWAKL
jgi:L-fucose isomerase-like protein